MARSTAPVAERAYDVGRAMSLPSAHRMEWAARRPRSPRRRLPALGALALALTLASPALARLPSQAPPLPPADPGEYTLIEVSTAQELADACWNLTDDQAIIIAPGTYDLANVSFPNGVDGRLTVGRFGAPLISNIQIRGATGDPTDVVLLGAGPLDPIVPFGFQLFTATDVTIADLSVGNVYYHAIAIQGDQGAQRTRLYNVRAFDAGQQIVKGIAGAHDVVIEYSEFFHSAGAAAHPEGSPPDSCYTNAIDALGVDGWRIADNLIHGIYCQDLSLAGPAVLMWGGSTGTVVERNTIVDSSRGVHLGLVDSADHLGGVVRNNFIRWDPAVPYAVDVGIYTTSAGALVLHNSILTNGRYPNAIEVRFAGATGVEVRHNLLDAAITPRDGAMPTVVDNATDALPDWFVDEAQGDLHLASATPPIDQVDRLPEALDDFDAAPRPAAAGAVDLGADEWGAGGVLFADGFETGDTSRWSETVP